MGPPWYWTWFRPDRRDADNAVDRRDAWAEAEAEAMLRQARNGEAVAKCPSPPSSLVTEARTGGRLPGGNVLAVGLAVAVSRTDRANYRRAFGPWRTGPV